MIAFPPQLPRNYPATAPQLPCDPRHPRNSPQYPAIPATAPQFPAIPRDSPSSLCPMKMERG
jgi:hypothetical protein